MAQNPNQNEIKTSGRKGSKNIIDIQANTTMLETLFFSEKQAGIVIKYLSQLDLSVSGQEAEMMHMLWEKEFRGWGRWWLVSLSLFFLHLRLQGQKG